MKWMFAMIVGVGLLALPAQAAHHADSATRTIRLLSANASVRVTVDRAPKGKPSKGDVVQERSTLRNVVPQFGRAKGAVVGSDVANYTITSVGPPIRMDVKVTVKLPGGTLRATASIAGSANPKIRVVGGTGAFANARGTGAVSDPNGPKPGVLNVYRLQLP